MAKQFLHHLGVDTEAEQEGGGAMAQIVKTNVWQVRFFQQLLELIDDVIGSEMRTCERTENIIVFLPGKASFYFRLYLAQAMLLQCLKSNWGKRYTTAALLRFGVRLYKLSY